MACYTSYINAPHVTHPSYIPYLGNKLLGDSFGISHILPLIDGMTEDSIFISDSLLYQVFIGSLKQQPVLR